MALGAPSPVEHPGRNLQEAVCLRTVQSAAEKHAIGLLDDRVNPHLVRKPGMMRVQNLTPDGLVGVLKPCCTTTSDRTARSAIYRPPNTPIAALPTCNGTVRCTTSRAPRPVPLHHRASQAQMKPGFYPALDEPRGSGGGPRDVTVCCQRVQRGPKSLIYFPVWTSGGLGLRSGGGLISSPFDWSSLAFSIRTLARSGFWIDLANSSSVAA